MRGGRASSQKNGAMNSPAAINQRERRMTEEKPNPLIAFEDEMQILDWVDSPRGAKVTFLLPGEYSIHPFKQFRSSTRFFARFLELDDQDQIVDQERREEVARIMDRREGRGARLSREAAFLCKNTKFHEYICRTLFSLTGVEKQDLARTFPHSLVTQLRAEGSRVMDEPERAEVVSTYYIYHVCDIKSRRELDQATPSGKENRKAMKFHALIVEPFYKWRTGDGDQRREREGSEVGDPGRVEANGVPDVQ